MKAILIILIANITVFSYSQNYQFDWALQIGGIDNDKVVDIKTDLNGNSYVLGHFSGTVDLDPTADVFEVSSNGGSDLYVVKLTADGGFLWGKRLGGIGNESPVNVQLDGNGNLYFSGKFSDAVDFDPGSSAFNLTASGSSDIFFTKLDANGDFVWAKQLGNASSLEYVSAMVIDGANMYATGGCTSNVDFDLNSGTTLLNGDNSNVYFAKYDLDGNLVWVKGIGNANLYTFTSSGISVDVLGNVYAAGYFTGTIDFDPSAGTSSMTSVDGSDGFILKLSSTGDFVWTKQIAGTEGQSISSITVASNSIYIGGGIYNTTDFDPGSGVENLSGDVGFVCKWSTDGAFQWVQSAADYIHTLLISEQETAFALGYASQSGSYNVIINKFSSSGMLDWYKTYGGTEDDFGSNMCFNQDAELYIVGSFEGLVDFNTESAEYYLTSAGLADGSIVKLKIDDTGIAETENTLLATIYPNPSTEGLFTISTETSYEYLNIAVYSADGRLILEENRSFTTQPCTFHIEASEGVFVVEITTDNGRKVMHKISKQ